ncbi:Basal Body-Orientation Factor 1 [Manis pentadactyla]|nr:Basal Body-Orientation Factor 1 [Manis pentadactyla]
MNLSLPTNVSTVTRNTKTNTTGPCQFTLYCSYATAWMISLQEDIVDTEDWVEISATLHILSLKNIQEERFTRQLGSEGQTTGGSQRPPFVSPFSSVLVSRFLPRAAALVYAVPSGK